MNNLRKILQEQGATETQLAEAIGVSRPAVNRWCTMARSIPMDKVPVICEALNITEEQLFLETDKA